MRARASTKTQRRMKQMQLHDPYELTDDVYDVNVKPPQTLRVGGLVTAAGALQGAAAVALCGYLFGPALLFCALLLVAVGALGFAQLGKTTGTGARKRQKRGLASHVSETLEHLRALQRGALDYSFTLSIADSAPIRDDAGRGSRAARRSADRALAYERQTQWRPQATEVQIAVVPTRPTPQNVVAAMDMTLPLSPVIASMSKPRKTKKQESQRLQQRPKSASEPQLKSTAPLARDEPIVTLNKVVMAPLQVPGALQRQKPKPQKPQQVTPQQKAQPKKRQQQQQQQQQKVDSPQQLPVLQQPKLEIQPEPQQTPLEPVRVERKQESVHLDVVVTASPCVEQVKPVELVSPASVPSLPVFPEPTPIAERARAEPMLERDVVSTRQVLLYLNPSVTVQEEEDDFEQEQEEEDWEPETAAAVVNVLGEEWPALTASPSTQPQLKLQAKAPAADVEPNFLLDIALEAISTPAEAELTVASPLKSVGNPELRAMLTELDQMRLELDAAMASCTAALAGKEDNLAVSSFQPEMELEPEVGAELSC